MAVDVLVDAGELVGVVERPLQAEGLLPWSLVEQLRVHFAAVVAPARSGAEVMVAESPAECLEAPSQLEMKVFETVDRGRQELVGPAVESVQGRQRRAELPVARAAAEPLPAESNGDRLRAVAERGEEVLGVEMARVVGVVALQRGLELPANRPPCGELPVARRFKEEADGPDQGLDAVALNASADSYSPWNSNTNSRGQGRRARSPGSP